MRIMNMLNETSKRTWKKVCESMRMNGTDSDFVQWVDETKAIVAECGDAAFSEIAAMSGVDRMTSKRSFISLLIVLNADLC